MTQLWRHPDGTLLTNGGTLCRAEEYPCECPAPCACPCGGTWPPAEWPCGGLLETYSVNSFIRYTTSALTTPEIRLKNPASITATYIGPGRCHWENLDVVLQYWDSVDETWVDYEATGRVGISHFCREWSIGIGFANFTTFANKFTGLSPVGDYTSSNNKTFASVS